MKATDIILIHRCFYRTIPGIIWFVARSISSFSTSATWPPCASIFFIFYFSVNNHVLIGLQKKNKAKSALFMQFILAATACDQARHQFYVNLDKWVIFSQRELCRPLILGRLVGLERHNCKFTQLGPVCYKLWYAPNGKILIPTIIMAILIKKSQN